MVKGYHSVDFELNAVGHGCVNWNGRATFRGEDGSFINNHSYPKMRGLNLFSEETYKDKNGNTRNFPIGVHDISFKKNPVYVSQNCQRYNIFKNVMPHHIPEIDPTYAPTLLSNVAGLLRGFAITDKVPLMRKSPLLVEDLVEQNGNGNFEILSLNSRRASQTFFSETTIGDTKYKGYHSINIEDLQFISCDGIFGRPAIQRNFTQAQFTQLEQDITAYLQNEAAKMNLALSPKVEYNECWIRCGAILGMGEQGFLLNQDAIRVIIEWYLQTLQNLYIHQSQGWLGNLEVKVDYNNGARMRIKEDSGLAQKQFDALIGFETYYRKGTSEEQLASDLERKKWQEQKTKKQKKNKEQENEQAVESEPAEEPADQAQELAQEPI